MLHLAGRPGDFLTRGSALARVVPAGRLDEDLAAAQDVSLETFCRAIANQWNNETAERGRSVAVDFTV